jgi:cytochrome b subunit of formate dehydrogenase/nitrate/TMAO reductase-like tetraheme cytochrome c subunit
MSKKTTSYQRFPLARRIEHVIMLLSFGTLGLTGLPQKYPLAGISVWFVDLLGGIENLRAIHHVSATVMMLGTAWHIILAGYKVFVLREKLSMLPSLQDVKDGWQALMHNIGLAKKFPQMGRYTFEEKLEYWAFVWGAVVMGLTGFLMWNPITAAKILPGEWIPAAKAAHGGEAVLAVLAIIVWHMYGVHIRNFNKSMWTGKMSEEEMLHEHPLELADIKAGVANRQVKPEFLRKRQRIYYPVAGILTAVMLAGVYGFVNTEETALTTIPPQPSPIAVYVPQTPTPVPTQPPTPTPLPATATPEGGVAEETVSPVWDDVATLILAKCAACHSTLDMTGLAMDTYANTMAGGKDGPVVVPGDSANSILYTLQAVGGHPGQFSEDELDVVQAWIDAGAPESARVPAGPTWDDVAPLFQEKCGTCHNTADMTGLALDTYADAMAGGKNGEVILPGDSANSVLYTLQAAGGHPGTLTSEELALVQEWIDAGAVESDGSASGPVWSEVAPLFEAKCGSCHSTPDMTGLALDTFADAMAGGKNGAIITPGDSVNSVLYTLQAAGGHPGQLSEDELAIVQAWIDAGAMEK